MKGFKPFLKALAGNAAVLTNRTDQRGTVLVLGNESADMDSVVSSISLAYLLQATLPQTHWAIPVINTNRADMSLRPDCQAALQSIMPAASLDSLTFIDDLDPDGRIWLVDHNAPAARQSELEPLVEGIVDHHVDEGRCLGAKWRQIEMVGSCSTLVAERLFRQAQSHPDLMDADLAKLLLGAILLDTSNLDPAAQRATSRDVEMANWLTPQVSWIAAGSIAPESLNVSNPRELYKALDKLKGRVSHLSARDLLRKDYKQWAVGKWNVGISSISYRLAKWIKRDGREEIENSVMAWIEEQQLQVAMVMTHGKVKQHGEKTYGRELLVSFAPAVDLGWRRFIVDELVKSDTLQLAPFFDEVDLQSRTSFFVQSRKESSRKQVFPTIKSILEAIS
ncbi:Exopolyphosphatase [Coemansia sp. RSA 989]|nr:Exopolyphosphatase [Coemansia sp. RSA 1086]KAJ1865073.1 Exopolyphosphatase [Coemansia sp. RSA 989]KAJ2675344.1 Exopolyphosphatase [Coemansia sp. RSA 1085]